MSSPFQSPTPSDQGNALLIAVRFSASIPDLQLDVPEPENTTGAGLKQLIRADLPKDLSSHRLRLIYAGRGLEDTTALTVSLKLPTPPRSSPASEPDNVKGKQAVRDARPRIYIHCSIGDIALSEKDLANEASVSSTLQRRQSSKPTDADERSPLVPPAQPQTTPAPRGFDRLLSAGFTAAEVTALRSQFLAMQSVSHTRDTMPSGEQLRDLEDRWMDEGSTAVQVADGGNDEGVGNGSHGEIDDLVWGAVMGFFWPIGCAMWLRREEGVWSWRKALAVSGGVALNAAFGAMRIMG
ncbi:hypothetical protein N7541_007354 [Penicillium brevicompactum]|uniref:Ubiquitin-like domain-containing protein n=1 Tax=Penicillium brevicompactum TaxID=5074 RepID=A0A9W9QX00_PENBR|nr:hypothetical protein N7541_007354 [Penicillium brevicompactum]